MMRILLILCILINWSCSHFQKKKNDLKVCEMEIVTYKDWNLSVLEAMNNIKIKNDQKYILDNLKVSLSLINQPIFDNLIDTLKYAISDIDSCEVNILFYITEGEICTSILKFIVFDKSKCYSIKYTINAGQKGIFGKTRRESQGCKHSLLILAYSKQKIDLSPNVLFVTILKQEELKTNYVVINENLIINLIGK